MKEFIRINYGITIKTLYLKNKSYFFYVNNQKIKIVETMYEEEKLRHLFEISNHIYNSGMKINTFLINNFGNCFTSKNKKNIVLLKENNFDNDITLEYIKKFNKIENNLFEYNLLSEWKKQVDYLERKMFEYNKEYLIIQNSINYYLGMAENAIALLNNVNIENYKKKLTLGHEISYNEYEISNFDNPFCFIKTNYMYDIANYFKYNFYKNSINYEELDNFLFRILDEDDKIVFFANLLYPNYYFESVISILNGEKTILEKNIENNFLKMIKKYEKFLEYCKNRLKNVKLINLITWIDD